MIEKPGLPLLEKVTMYTRASASDYDDWETKYGNPGWGCKDLIPLLKKVSRISLGLRLLWFDSLQGRDFRSEV